MRTPDQIDYDARVYVNGLRRAQTPEGPGALTLATGEWAPRFRAHPWVIQAEAEGWGRELRQHCVGAVKQALAAGVSAPAIETVMPDRELIEHWRKNAKRYALAAEWRERMVDEYGSIEGFLERRRPGLARRRHLDGGKAIGDVARKLTPTSQRMTGEHTE